MKLHKESLGLYEKAIPFEIEWETKLSAAKTEGYDFLEISIDESEERMSRLDWDMDKRKSLVYASLETGLPICTMCLSGHRKYPLGSGKTAIAQKSLEIMDKAIDFAVDIGVRIIQLAGYDVYYNEQCTPETRERFALNLKKCIEMASRKGVILALETMENDFMNTVEKAMKFVRMLNSPYLKVYPDTGNISNALSDVQADIMHGNGHIVAAHLKETRPGVFREVPYGEGHVDFIKAIKACKRVGVNMFLAEFWYKEGSNWRQVLRQNNQFLREKIALADTTGEV